MSQPPLHGPKSREPPQRGNANPDAETVKRYLRLLGLPTDTTGDIAAPYVEDRR